jgi:hypothetical protein
MTSMTRSRTRLKASSAWVTLALLLLLCGVANAGRKRIVVLEFEGDKAEKFHEDVVRLIKKSHTVVSLDKWNGTAEELSATKPTDKNIKKVAKKLKIDGVVTGTVEKRRDEYILRLKLRSGASGELVGNTVNIKSESAKLDGTAAKDLKDELIDSIGGLESNRDGGGGGDDEAEEEKPKKGGTAKKPDDEEEKPKKGGFVKKGDDEEEKPKKAAAAEEKPKKAAAAEEKPKKAAAAEEKPKKGGTAKKPDDEEVAALKPKSDDEKPKKSKPDDEDEDKDKPKKVARKDDDEDDDDDGGGGDDDTQISKSVALTGAAVYAPGERAIDAAVGMSFTARRMAFSFDPNQVTQRPAGYKQSTPVPGAYIDVTAYPLSFGHDRKDILRHLGVTLMFDRVLSINSKNPNTMTTLKSSEQRFAIGATFRYPLGQGASAPVVGAALRYNKQSFTIQGDAVIPDVSYSMFDLTGTFALPIGAKMVLNLNAALLLPLNAGEITLLAQYGRAKITGFEGSAGLDYMLLKNIFARAEGRFETLGYAFKQEGMRSPGVGGARDTYYGGVVTAGYLF